MTGLRPLGIAKEILAGIGLEVTYVYDDLVFVEHTAFLLQFDDVNPENLKLYFNVDCEAEAAETLEAQLIHAAKAQNFTIQNNGKFELKQKEGVEEFEIRFLAG